MHTLIQQVANCIEREQLAQDGQTIYVAVSGGADSVALLTALHMLGKYRLKALHCNFALRGDESDADEAFVRSYVAQLGIELEVKHYDTLAYAREQGLSIEMAARELRYTWFLERLTREQDASIAIAHNADDAVETLLYNLTQGTSIRGLVGIPYKRNERIIRPMLDVPRSEVLAFLQSNTYTSTWREDSSNADISYRRNYIRHKLIPCLEGLKAGAKRQINLSIKQLRGVEAFYRASIEQYKQKVWDTERGIDIDKLLSSPSPETLLFELLYPYGFGSSQCYDIAEALPYMRSGAEFLSPTHRLVRSWAYLELMERCHKEQATCIIDTSTLPLEIRLDNGGLVSCSLAPSPILREVDTLSLPKSMWQGRELLVRSTKAGDKMQVFGMKSGRKRLSRILIDAKVAHRQREEALVVELEGEILWLVAHCKSERTRLPIELEQDEEYLIIRYQAT